MTVSALCADSGFSASDKLDVGEFLAANDALLRFDGKSIPCLHVMKVLLDNHIAAAFKGRVFVANNCSLASGVSSRIFRAIDEPDDITVFEISEALNLVSN